MSDENLSRRLYDVRQDGVVDAAAERDWLEYRVDRLEGRIEALEAGETTSGSPDDKHPGVDPANVVHTDELVQQQRHQQLEALAADLADRASYLATEPGVLNELIHRARELTK